MKPIKLVTPISGDPDAPTQNLVGLGALAAELAAEGISVRDLFARTGIDAAQLEDVHARISHRQRLAIYRNAKRLAKRSDIGLLAGARQRISDYGIYGYAPHPFLALSPIGLISDRKLDFERSETTHSWRKHPPVDLEY